MAMDAALLASKRAVLDKSMRCLGRTLIAYSGGVDSAFLAWAAHQVLGSDMLAVIADSPSLARAQFADAIAFAQEQHIPLEVISTTELDRTEYARNDAFRCFHCKDELFNVMHDIVRIEIACDELPRALTSAMAARVSRIFKALGFKFVTLDLEGFRSGSMNALLPADQLLRHG